MGWKGMMFLRLALCLLLLVITPLPSFAAGDEGVFRGFVWGVTKEDVRKFEKARFYKEEGDALFFLEKPDRFRRLITYRFADGGLIGAKYEMVEYHEPDPQDVLTRSADWTNQLKEKYGEPSAEEMIWKNKFYRTRPNFWFRAMRRGDLRIESKWTISGGGVVMKNYHDGYNYQLYYTVEKNTPAIDPTQGLLNLALQGTKTP